MMPVDVRAERELRLAEAFACPTGTCGSDPCSCVEDCRIDGVYRFVGGESRRDTRGFYEAPDASRYGHRSMPQRESNAVDGFLRSLPAEALVVEIGSGRGHFVSAHPRIVATDYSLYALHQFCGGGPRIHLDAQLLPFRDESIDAFFSVATLEHVPDPARALAEIDRCLAVNGSVLMFPAWLVFPWLGKDLERRPFRELSLRDRLRKLTIPVRKRPLYRFLRVLPRRLLREGRALRRLAVPFDFDELEPNFETYLTSDSDAFTSMDPHACATFFRSRGYVVDGCETFRRRLMLRYVPIVAHKVAPRRAATGCDGGAN